MFEPQRHPQQMFQQNTFLRFRQRRLVTAGACRRPTAEARALIMALITHTGNTRFTHRACVVSTHYIDLHRESLQRRARRERGATISVSERQRPADNNTSWFRVYAFNKESGNLHGMLHFQPWRTVLRYAPPGPFASPLGLRPPRRLPRGLPGR